MKRLKLFFLLLLGYLSTQAAKVDTLAVESQSMQKSIKNVIITPNQYSSQKNPFAVLYLLHGAGGNYASWIKRVPEIAGYADRYNLIIVCPDAASTSWYFDSPIDSSMKYETYVAKELVPWIDENYKTISNKSGRAITGLSMGGHGALYLAFRHPDIWGAAGSMSGGLDFRPFPQKWDIALRLGSYEANKGRWDKYTVINMIPLLKDSNLKLIIDCGVNDFFLAGNRQMHTKLLEANIPHDYIERPGEHNWDYWANAIKYQLLFFNDYFN